MGVWLILALLFWVLVFGCLMAGRKQHTGFAFFDGLLLSFLCFKLLPEAFLETSFWPSVLGLLMGAAAGPGLEAVRRLHRPMNSPFWHCTVFSLSILFFWKGPYLGGGLFAVFILAFVGGFFLSVACGGILPEQEDIRLRAFAGIFGAAGFMLGTCYLYVC